MSTVTCSRLIIFNTSILTAYGTFTYNPISLQDAKQLIREFQQAGKSIVSAIGHQSTADLLSMLLEYHIPLNHQEVEQVTDDLALIFKLNCRPKEGKILTLEEMVKIGYEFGSLTRTS